MKYYNADAKPSYIQRSSTSMLRNGSTPRYIYDNISILNITMKTPSRYITIV